MTVQQSPPSPTWLADLVIRNLEKNDLPALEWGGEYAHFRRLYADIFESAQRGRAVLWVADLKTVGIIGQLFVQLSSARPELADGVRRAYIYGFRVQSPYRGYQIGTRMMKVAEADLARRKYRWVTLNVGVDNPDARRLYERLGYAVVDNEPGRWSYQDDAGERREVHEPALRMEKRIGFDPIR